MAHRRETDNFDELTAHDLRTHGSVNWSEFGDDVLGAVVAEMDFGTAPPVVAALRAAVDRMSLGYPPSPQLEELREACAEWQRQRYGWAVAPARVHPVADVLTAYELTINHLTRPDSPVIVPTPAYPSFLTVPLRHGREVIQVPMQREHGRYVLDLAGLAAAFRAGGHLLVLCHPANPVGRVFTPAELAAVTDLVDQHGGRVFSDEVHAPLTYPGHPHIPYAATSPTAAGHTLTAVSASKAWNVAGLKCAQVIVDPADAPIWERVAGPGPATPSSLGVAAAIAAYQDGAAWLDHVLGYLERNRRRLSALLADQLPQVGHQPPEGTYLAWWDCRGLALGDRPAAPAGGPEADQPAKPPTEPRAESPAEFFRRRADVALLDGARCGEAGRGFVRLNFATPLPILEQMVTRMRRALTG